MRSEPGALRGVIFDMDGTLVDSEAVTVAAKRAVAKRLGIADMDEAITGSIGLRADLVRVRLAAALRQRVDISDFLEEVASEKAGLLKAGMPVKPGARELIAGLRAAGFPLGLATSSMSDHADRLLSKLGLRDVFTVLVGGDQVERPKPDPEIYRMAARGLGLDPADCAAFEDSDPGTRAALAAGCRVVMVPDLAQPSAELRALGPIVAESLLAGAEALGLPSGASASSVA